MSVFSLVFIYSSLHPPISAPKIFYTLTCIRSGIIGSGGEVAPHRLGSVGDLVCRCLEPL